MTSTARFAPLWKKRLWHRPGGITLAQQNNHSIVLRVDQPVRADIGHRAFNGEHTWSVQATGRNADNVIAQLTPALKKLAQKLELTGKTELKLTLPGFEPVPQTTAAALSASILGMQELEETLLSANDLKQIWSTMKEKALPLDGANTGVHDMTTGLWVSEAVNLTPTHAIFGYNPLATSEKNDFGDLDLDITKHYQKNEISSIVNEIWQRNGISEPLNVIGADASAFAILVPKGTSVSTNVQTLGIQLKAHEFFNQYRFTSTVLR